MLRYDSCNDYYYNTNGSIPKSSSVASVSALLLKLLLLVQVL